MFLKKIAWSFMAMSVITFSAAIAQAEDFQAQGNNSVADIAARNTKPSDIDGDWVGMVDLRQMKLHMVMHIVNTENGLNILMDIPDQNASGLRTREITRNGDNLKLEMESVKAEIEGTFSSDRITFTGTLKQGASFPMVLNRTTSKSELKPPARPQNPVKPYPYREEEVIYDNKTAGIQLGGTLTIPPGKGPFPAVVLITGSGQQGRDETLLGQKPFLVLSDYLTRRGIAVLRVDDRGMGKSTGNFNTSTTADFATDTEAGIAFLKTRVEVNSKKIGLIGHSEGGIIAPMLAARNHDVAFIVMMAGTGLPGDEILASQAQLLSEAAGASHAVAEKNAAKEREVLALVKQENKGKDDAALEKQIREKLAGEIPDAALGAEIRKLNSPWVRYFIAYDPSIALEKVTCPVLALNGEKDLQVSPKQNLPAIRRALEAAGNKNFETVELPGLNHLFQTAKTGAINEYAQIEETIAPAALDKIGSWIEKVTGTN
jgi:pimeloyl-ACP methyl ester carboxylesterase